MPLLRPPGLEHHSIDRCLKTLVEIGWVKENKYRPKTYQINLENETVKTLMEFLQKIRARLTPYRPPTQLFTDSLNICESMYTLRGR